MAKAEKDNRDRKGFFGRRADSDDGFDIITEAKEPFSFQNFFEAQVMDRARRFKELLADKGILFFLTSPFSARGRLIAQMAVLCVGIAFGVLPRASSLMTAMQDRAYSSELAGLQEKNVGSITITPAASSNYQRMHLLAFVIEGSGLPSSASKYEVHLARGYGASDWKDVSYAWDIYPVNDTQRILLVAVDQSRQKSGYGGFQLYVQLAGDEVPEYGRTPFEVTLTTAQETDKLYDRKGVHLSELTKTICGKGQISEKQGEFEKALKEYETVLEQAENMPVDIEVSPTAKELEATCLANRLYRTLTDKSTTEDVTDLVKADEMPEISMDTMIFSSGIEYDAEFISELEESGLASDEDMFIFDAFASVDSAKNAVITAMNGVNTASSAWYELLAGCRFVLNQDVSIASFPYFARCTDTIDDDIEYIKASEFLPKEDGTDEDAGKKGSDMDGLDAEDKKPDEKENPDGAAPDEEDISDLEENKAGGAKKVRVGTPKDKPDDGGADSD